MSELDGSMSVLHGTLTIMYVEFLVCDPSILRMMTNCPPLPQWYQLESLIPFLFITSKLR